MKKIFKKRGNRYLVAFLVMFFMLISMTVQPMMTNTFGKEITIKTKPFDPRDVFRGDYVQLYYDINDITLDRLEDRILNMKDKKEDYDPFKVLRGKKLYVTLKEDKGFYIVDKVTLKKPKDGIFIMAKYSHPVFAENTNGKITGIAVDYRLDKYFLPENTGKELEQKALQGEIYAKIKVYRGYSLLREIYPK